MTRPLTIVGRYDLVGETMRCASHRPGNRQGRGEPTPREHRDQASGGPRTHQAIEGHRGDMVEDCAQLQTETAMGGQQRITSHLRSHLTIAQDEVGEDREHGAARGALETPDGDPTETDTRIMRVTGEAPAAATGCLVEELKAKGQEKGEDAFDKRLPVTQEVTVGRFVLKIDRDGAVCACRCRCFLHVSPPGPQVSSADETQWREHFEISRQS